MMRPAVILLLPLIAGATAAMAAPATRPAPMPSQFDVLLNRSIFVKGHPPASPRPPTSRPVHQPLEAVLVFNGVTQVGAQRTAFIENRSTGQVSLVRVNDDIAQGKIIGISLDSLQYESNGKVTRISIGDNFQGTPAREPTSRPSGTTNPATAASPEMQSVLERLRQRRMKELHKD